jgi:hypothetical protein
MSSVPSSSERSGGVAGDRVPAMYWSIDLFDSMRLKSPLWPTGPLPFMNAALATHVDAAHVLSTLPEPSSG